MRSKKDKNQAVGRSAGGLSKKIHPACDALGNSIAFYLTKGQDHDVDGADALMDRLTTEEAVLADKAYNPEGWGTRLKKMDVQL